MIFQNLCENSTILLEWGSLKGVSLAFCLRVFFSEAFLKACRHIQLLGVDYVCCELADVRKYFFRKAQRMFLNRTETSQVITAFTYRTYIVFTCQRREMLLQKNINVLTRFLNLIINEEITRYSCPR